MDRKMIRSERLNESYTRVEHSSGLTLMLCPMPGYSTAYALFATKYGSVDTCFKTDGDDDFVTVPEGIAHFLEHKLFESEDGDAFSRYAKTGASANAYTSFDRTAYLFSCSENLIESLEILLDFVQAPYFTEKTVRKEQGIIGQEIQMFNDNADWRVMFNLLGALYHNNPVRIDIAGTVDSIAQIDAELLYRCYRTFYNLHNMVLSVAGNFSVDEVLSLADRMLKPAKELKILRRSPEEPPEIRTRKVEQVLPVAQPMFQIGFKGQAGDDRENLYGQIYDEILLDVIAGEATPLYRRLYDEGLINQTFAGEAMSSRDYAVAMYGGESRDPQKVFDAVLAEVERVRAEGIDPAVFARYKKAAYGRYVGAFGKVESVASLMMLTHFAGVDSIYRLPEKIAALTIGELAARLRTSFDPARSALSIIKSS